MVIYAAFVQNLQERHQNNIIQKQPPECFIKKAVLKSFAIFPGKRLCWSLLLIKFPSFRPTSSQFFDKVAAQLYQKETPIQVFSSECCGIIIKCCGELNNKISKQIILKYQAPSQHLFVQRRQQMKFKKMSKRCEICSNLKTRTTSVTFLLFLLLTLNK